MPKFFFFNNKNPNRVSIFRNISRDYLREITFTNHWKIGEFENFVYPNWISRDGFPKFPRNRRKIGSKVFPTRFEEPNPILNNYEKNNKIFYTSNFYERIFNDSQQFFNSSFKLSTRSTRVPFSKIFIFLIIEDSLFSNANINYS